MILTCPQCHTRYQADAAKFPPAGRDVRCARCGCLWHQDPPLTDDQQQMAASESQDALPHQHDAMAYSYQDAQVEPVYDSGPAQPSYGRTPSEMPYGQEHPVSYGPSQPEPSYGPAETYGREENYDRGASYGQAQSYAQSEAYSQPQESRAREPRQPRPPKAPSAWGRRVALGTGWLALLAILGVIIVGATLYQQKIVRAFPQSASLYSKLGVKVNTSGLQFDNVRYHEDVQDGQTVLTVTGRIVNITDHEQRVPQIRVGLSDTNKHELYHWTFTPDVMTLNPGKSTKFVTKLSSPPATARHLDVRFVRAGE